MSNTVQNINTIAPMEAKEEKEQTDFEKGKAFLSNNDVAQAAVAFHNALLDAEEKNDESAIANACNQLGHVCIERQEYEQAHKHYSRAYAICDKHDDPMSLLALDKQFILVYKGLKQYKDAISKCFELLDVYYNNNDQQGTVVVLEDMADIYLDMEDKEKAADCYKTIAAIHANYKHETIADEYLNKAKELE